MTYSIKTKISGTFPAAVRNALRVAAIGGVMGVIGVAGPVFAQKYPSGTDVANEAMARARAEKARNDAIVQQQRAAQEQQRRMQEQRVRDLENAQKRGRTG